MVKTLIKFLKKALELEQTHNNEIIEEALAKARELLAEMREING